MQALLLTLLGSMFTKLITDKFFYAFIVHLLNAAALKTENNLDDKLVDDVRKALGVVD